MTADKIIKQESTTFADLNLTREMQRAIADMGFEEPTPIQSRAILPIMEGKDVIGHAYTGTGKTAAYGIPTLEKIDPKDHRIQSIILCPTRELAIQIHQEFLETSQSPCRLKNARIPTMPNDGVVALFCQPVCLVL